MSARTFSRAILHRAISRSALLSLAATCAFLSNTISLTVPVPANAQSINANQQSPNQRGFQGQGSGQLLAMGIGGKNLGQCPLKHTDVKASVSGYVARVSVKQTFQNTFKDKIEAVYTFPLPENAAVDEMTMKVGKRIIRGNIKKKEEAREIYEQAKARGNVASLLDQERPNIFTQSVANIEPGESVEIEIKYVDLLPYEAGAYTFAFPTVVGPRFNPGNPTGRTGTGRAHDTDVVPDASKITPAMVGRGERAGHDISIEMDIDAGVPIHSMTSKLHEIKLDHANISPKAHLSLVDKNTIPNKDFVVSWEVASDKVQSGYLTHNDGKSGYFTLMLMPPKRVTVENVAPKEMIFLVDCSGSQSGAPLEKAKETLTYIVDHMNPKDTFQIISFSDHLLQFAERPQTASAEMRSKAKSFIQKLQANGGTWMAPAVEKACSMPTSENRLRVVTFMTDGYVGNDFEVMGMIKKFRGKSRWFSFGTGNSVNRFLIDGIATAGGGEADYVLLNTSGEAVGKKFYDRIKSPVLTDVKLDFDGLQVKEVYPYEISDVWAEKPLYIKGRYLKPGAGTITLNGFAGGKPYKQELKVNFPEKQSANEVIKPIWARAKVDRLMSEDWIGAQGGAVNAELKDEIVKTALEHHIMTQYTSFVAVEEKVITKGGVAKTVAVPVETPDGVTMNDALEEGEGASSASYTTAYGSMTKSVSRRAKTRGRSGGGGVGWSSGAVMGGPGVGGNGGSGYALPSAPLPASAMGASAALPAPSTVAYPTRANVGSAPPIQAIAVKPKAAREESLIINNSPVIRDFRAPAGKEQQFQEKKDKAAAPVDADSKLEAKADNKLDSLLLTLVQALTKNPNATLPGLQIANGKVLVKITLTEVSETIIQKLKAFGFEVVVTEGKTLVGRLPIQQLAPVAHFTGVVRIEPKK